MSVTTKAKPAAISTWISVHDSLPPKENNFYYWLYFEFNDSYDEGEYDYEENRFYSKDGSPVYGVSHWMKPYPPTK